MASSWTGSSSLVRFGGEFELDPSAYELRRSGQPLKLERIPTEVLLLLVEQRGALVTRQQIVDRVWGKDVFLDTDNSINAAIRKIRQVLKDDPEQPRFVQTLTGRGYRFIASVEESGPQFVTPYSPAGQPSSLREQLLGKKVSHYRILEVLGGGGMGVVYKAEDLKLGRRVALKFLPSELASDPKALDRMQCEARAASSLDHPNICAIYELGEHEGQPFIAMQLLEGQTLREWIEKAPSSLSGGLAQIVDLAMQIADGLEAAHRKGIIHRDIKPANIFVTDRSQAKILDFGIAKFLDEVEVSNATPKSTPKSGESYANDSPLTRTGASLGTPSYLSPEQIRQEKLDARTDIFSFGLVLYEMVTGQQAFSGNTVSVIRNAVLNQPPVPARQVRPEIPAKLESIVSKSLNKDKESRYQSAEQMRIDLSELRADLAVVKPRLRWAWPWVAALVGFFILALAFFKVPGIRRRMFERASTGEPAGVNARRSVAVLGFRNLSGREDQAWISTALSEMLSSDLSAGQQLRVIPGEDVARMKLDLNLPAADNYSGNTLHQIRTHLGSDVVVLGSYLAMGKDTGGKVRIDLQLQDARLGETIGAIRSDGTEAELADLVSRSGARLRQELGVPEVGAEDARRLSASVPANPEAARLYAEGLAKLHDYDALAARDLLERAIRLDPKHALSHAALAEAWSALGYDAKAESEAKSALDLSGDLPREQRLSIEGRSHEYARDLPGAIEIYKTLRNFFPDHLDYALRLAAAQTKAELGKDALQTISLARQLHQPDGDDPRIDLAEALAAERIGDFAGEQRAAATAVRKAQDRGNHLLLAEGKSAEAWSWERRGDLDKAALEWREVRALAAAAQNQRLLGLTLRHMGVLGEDKGEYEEARNSHESALAIFQKIGAQRQVARTFEALGNIDYQQERLPEAKRYYEEALQVDREISGPPGNIASDLGSIANVLDSSGDLLGATQMQERSLNGFREAGDKRGESDVLLNLANVLVERGELALAKQNYDQAFSVAQEIGYKNGQGSILNALVDIHLAQDRMQDARVAADQAIAIRHETQAQADIARSQVQLARVALEEGKAAESEQLTRQAAPVLEQQKMAGDASACAAVLARALLKQSRIDEAKAASDKALVFAHQTVDRPSHFAASLAAAEVNIARGKGVEASKALDLVITEAARHGYLGFEYEARLDLGKVELESGNHAAGQKRLQQLQEDAHGKNFLLIARKSKSALNASTHPL
jgi:serine/threonine protein kinase/tetratricopeptide (TPR) repeat protein